MKRFAPAVLFALVALSPRSAADPTGEERKWLEQVLFGTGAQREERLDQLLENMKFHKLKPEDYWWYAELRRYGTVPHAGFGLGFERLLMFLTGVSNIRDVIPFARTPGNAEF